MLKVECESCQAPYQIDERRIPKAGLKMRCPQCGHSFLVPNPSAAPEPAQSVPPDVPPPPDFDDIFGVKGMPGPPGIGSFATGLDDLDLDLPAVASDAALPAAVNRGAKKPAPPGVRPVAPKPAAAAAPKAATAVGMGPPAPAAAPVRPPSPSFVGFGMVEDDLPAVAGFGEIDFPAVKPAAPAAKAAPAPAKAAPAPAPAAAKAPAAAPAPKPEPQFGDLDLDIDLPSPFQAPAPDLPSPRGFKPTPASPAQEAGLPMAAAPRGADLPAFAGGAGGADLPSYAGAPGLPAPKDLDFGGLNLPGLLDDLPNLAGGGVGLPANTGGGVGLPASLGGGVGLPANAGGGVGLPAGLGGNLPSIHHGNLPANAGQGSLLPGQSNLPSAAQGNYLPAMGEQGTLLPGQADLPSYDAFGSLPQTAGSGGARGGYGGEPLTLDGPAPSHGGQAGGVSFGEVDLGGGNNADLTNVSLVGGGGTRPASAGISTPSVPVSRPRPGASGGSSQPIARGPRIIAGVLVAFVLGGAVLQATPYGAFGHHAISDAFHSGEWKKTTTQASTQARASLAKDVYGDARKTVSELVDIQSKNPRARQLATYAAFTEYAVELRFGVVPEHAAKASYLLGMIPPKTDAPYLAAAQGARAAVGGNYAEARAFLDTASRKDPSDPVQEDIKYVRGELELAAKDPDAAITAFSAAGQGATPRAHYGLARAYLMKNDRAKAKIELDATVAGSPEHVGALLARVRLLWKIKQDESSALRDLKVVIDGAARANASPTELSQAYALRGWVYLASNRASEARAAFDEAGKLDSRNASALIGQGEILYADGRYTDALARFDDAIQRAPEDVDAVCGSAKTKIALERLQEAKTQLTAARSTFKGEMGVALWLGKAEEALGNKSVAESEYNVAIELADPQLQNAVEPYSALATLLAAQGRGAEAFKKLEAAKTKLADTPALHRAFGDVLASQGKFDEAVVHYEKALSTKEDNGVRFRLGQMYRKMRKLDLATAEFAKVSEADKDYPGLALERGMLFEEAGEVQKALEQFQGALAKAPKDLDLMLRVGAAYVSIGQADEALKMLTKVYEQRPNSAEANHFLGRAYLRQGGLQVTAAMPRLRRAAELDPNRAEYHLYVAWAANEAAQPDIALAEKEVDRALALDSTLADAYWQRGVVKFKRSAVKDAERDLRKALELKPNRIEAHATMAEVLETNNNDAGALAEWAVATNATPKQAYWRYRYGKLLKAKGKGAEAAGHLGFAVQEALATQPRPGWLYAAALAAAESQRASGKKAEALENYKLYLQNAPTGDPDRADAAAAIKALGGTLPE